MEEKKKSKKGLIIGIIAGIVVVLGIIITVVVAKFGILGVNPKAILNTAKKVNDGEIEPEAFIVETLNENYEIADAKKEDVYTDVGGYIDVKDLRIEYLECIKDYYVDYLDEPFAKVKFRYTNIGNEPIKVDSRNICGKDPEGIWYMELESDNSIVDYFLQPNESAEFYVYFGMREELPTIEYYDYEYYTEKHIYFTIK